MSSTRAELNVIFADGQPANSITPADMREFVDSTALLTDQQGYSRAANPTTFTFSVTPGGALTAGVPATVTLAPVPPGLNGSDTLHRVLISGGSGTAEAVLITGGSAVAGAASGTIMFTPANNHSGAWTVSSASVGIQEAINHASATGVNRVEIGAGTHTVSPINVPAYMLVHGVGWATKLVPRLSTDYIFIQDNPTIDSPYDGTGHSHSIFREMQLSGRSLGTDTAVGIYLRGQSWVTIENILFDDINHGVFIDKCFSCVIDKCRLLDNTSFFIGSTTSTQTFHSSADIQVSRCIYRLTTYVEANIAMGRKILHFQGAVAVRIDNFNANALMFRGYGISIEAWSEDYEISNASILQGINNVQLLETTVDGLLGHPVSIAISGGAICAYGTRAIYIHKGGLFRIKGCDLTGTGTDRGTEVAAIEIGSGSGGVKVSGCDFMLAADGYAILVNAGADHVTIADNFFRESSPLADIKVTGDVTGGLSITNNTHSEFSVGPFLDNANTLAEQVIHGNIGIDDVGEQDVTAAEVIQFQGPIVKIDGSATISVINPPAYYTDIITIVPAAGSTWLMDAQGNIANPPTVHPGIVFQMRYVETGGPRWLVIGLAGLVA